LTYSIHLGDGLAGTLLDPVRQVIQLQLIVLNNWSVTSIVSAIWSLSFARSLNPYATISTIFQSQVGDLTGMAISGLSPV
jgi:hypothetical protein